MNQFIDTALTFPTIIFSVLLAVVAVYWVFGIVTGGLDFDGGGDAELGGADLDVGGGADGGLDLDGGDADLDGGDTDGGEGSGPIGTLWAALGLAQVPLAVSLSMVVVVAWFVSLAGNVLLDSMGASGISLVLLGLLVALVACTVGLVVASQLVRPIAKAFTTTPAERRSALVGRACVVRTNSITDSFGQAEVTDPQGATMLVQVRAAVPNNFSYGADALIHTYDATTEVYIVGDLDPVLRGDNSGDGPQKAGH